MRSVAPPFSQMSTTLSCFLLIRNQRVPRRSASFKPGLHALRHTFLTEAGEHTDPFTLQYVAGHDNIKTTMCYVHPAKKRLRNCFVRLANLERTEGRVECKGRCKIRCSRRYPQTVS